MPNHQHQSISLSGEGEEDILIFRMEQIMTELTKIMETVEAQQQTHMNINNTISIANSLSNTIPVFVRPEELE